MNHKLYIDPVSCQVKSPISSDSKIVFDRPYLLPDNDGHYVVVSRVGDDLLLIRIKQEGRKKPVQQGFVPQLSSTCGNRAYDGPRTRSFEIDLDPAKPIFPIADLVRQLRAAGVDRFDISPMFTPTLSDCVRSHSGLEMWSDGPIHVDRYGYESKRREEYLPRTEFTVCNATWAVRRSSQEGKRPLIHVYLWMGAAEKADKVLEAIRLLMRGEDASGANCAR